MIWTICTLPRSECWVLSQSAAVYYWKHYFTFLLWFDFIWSVLDILKPAVLKTCFLQVLPMYTYYDWE